MTDLEPAVAAPLLHLEVACGPRAGLRIPIAQPMFYIGRNRGCHLRPNSSAVSDFHCAILSADGQVFLRDLNSTTGSRVNGRRVHGAIELRDEDRLQAGPLCFVVRLPAPAVLGAVETAEAAVETPPPESAGRCEIVEVQPWGVLAASAESPPTETETAVTARAILDRYRRNRRQA